MEVFAPGIIMMYGTGWVITVAQQTRLWNSNRIICTYYLTMLHLHNFWLVMSLLACLGARKQFWDGQCDNLSDDWSKLFTPEARLAYLISSIRLGSGCPLASKPICSRLLGATTTISLETIFHASMLCVGLVSQP